MSRPRVLVVDDNPINLELISLLLEAEDFDVVSATDAQEALAAIERKTFDLFVLDVQLPGMSGLDLLRLLRSRPDTSKCCAVIVTSYAMEADRATAADAGCDAYFAKPIDTRTFARDVRAVYERGLSVSR
jgi:two-component system, cell cycle response regulator DivK